MQHMFCSPSVSLPKVLGSSSCRGKGIPHTVAGSVGTTDNIVVAALQKCQPLLPDTVQTKEGRRKKINK